MIKNEKWWAGTRFELVTPTMSILELVDGHHIALNDFNGLKI